MNSYMNVWASMLNICKRFKDANPAFQIQEVMDFDANVTENEYPAGNLIGIYQLDYSEDDQLVTGSCVFPIGVPASLDTVNLNKMAGAFGNFVRTQTTHPFYDYQSGQIIGKMKAQNALAISPTTKTTNRQFKYVLQTFGFDRPASFPQP